MPLDPLEILKRKASKDKADRVLAAGGPLGGTRAERLQRLQIGVFGIFAMVLLVGLADIVTNRLALTEAAAVPEAAPTVEATQSAVPRDPLVDAGVAPEVPEGTDASAAPAPPQGGATPERPSANAPLQ
ncbi:hypothetical protein GRI62_02495 [Erythrobacter arachoides]|uniref:Uncharacterized protein n=1 Tax=Aurantiacibacter arachoides TaxID=1850444 RepID=A0A844ZX54_9SPHN|nr:hypothetical protein [Aurantiacibacter arachoides]MXO92475.1 hypothetical protein [Aurantiacibacter arachoides]GGD56888.1 hypothetical protein GCM10011411_16140 [Aurantiacibacter arachoides]